MLTPIRRRVWVVGSCVFVLMLGFAMSLGANPYFTLNVGTITPTSVALSWNAFPFPVEVYMTWVATDPMMNNWTDLRCRTTNTSCTITGLTPATTYYINVSGYLNQVWVYPSNNVKVTTPAAPPPMPGVPAGWIGVPMSQHPADMAVGANGDVWFIDTSDNIYHLTSSGPVQAPGGAIRIAVDPNGVPWVVNRANQIWKWNGSSFGIMPGAAIDVACGANGSVWILGTDGVPAQWTGSGWNKIGGGGQRISVDGGGGVWVVNAYNQIYNYYPSVGWKLLPGAAQDISAGAGGSIYCLGMSGDSGGSYVYHWDSTAAGGGNWAQEPGISGTVVAAAAGNSVYIARTPASGLPTIMR